MMNFLEWLSKFWVLAQSPPIHTNQASTRTLVLDVSRAMAFLACEEKDTITW